jgi:hypothetical protein
LLLLSRRVLLHASVAHAWWFCCVALPICSVLFLSLASLSTLAVKTLGPLSGFSLSYVLL